MTGALSRSVIDDLLAALQRPGTTLEDDWYLHRLLERETVRSDIFSPACQVQALLQPAISTWAHRYFAYVTPSGSFAKGTANQSGTDIDLFISVNSETPK